VIPAVPELPDGEVDVQRLQAKGELSVTGLRTEPCTLNGAQREAQEMLADCRHRVSVGQYHALIELLDANPEFIRDAWVRETYLALAKSNLLRRRRGRIEGKRRFHPLIVVGLVHHLIANGTVATPEKAFYALHDLDLLKYDTAKDLYYRGRQQDRFRPILLEFPEFKQYLSREEGDALLRRVRLLQPHEQITYRGRAAELGEVEFVIKSD